MKKYLVTKVDFDTMENTYHQALISTILGYTDTRESAEEIISKMDLHEYKGWDGNEYPRCIITELEHLK